MGFHRLALGTSIRRFSMLWFYWCCSTDSLGGLHERRILSSLARIIAASAPWESQRPLLTAGPRRRCRATTSPRRRIRVAPRSRRRRGGFAAAAWILRVPNSTKALRWSMRRFRAESMTPVPALGFHPTCSCWQARTSSSDGYGNVLAPLLPLLITQLNLTLAGAGTLQMFFQLAKLVSQLGFGHLARSLAAAAAPAGRTGDRHRHAAASRPRAKRLAAGLDPRRGRSGGASVSTAAGRPGPSIRGHAGPFDVVPHHERDARSAMAPLIFAPFAGLRLARDAMADVPGSRRAGSAAAEIAVI